MCIIIKIRNNYKMNISKVEKMCDCDEKICDCEYSSFKYPTNKWDYKSIKEKTKLKGKIDYQLLKLVKKFIEKNDKIKDFDINKLYSYATDGFDTKEKIVDKTLEKMREDPDVFKSFSNVFEYGSTKNKRVITQKSKKHNKKQKKSKKVHKRTQKSKTKK